LKPRVLDAAGVSSEEDDPLLLQVVQTIEQAAGGDQCEMLFDAGRMQQLVWGSADAVEQAAAGTAAPETHADAAQTATPEAPATAEPHWDGERWLSYDAAAGAWVPMEAAADAPEPATAATGQVDAGAAMAQLLEHLKENDPDLAAQLEADPELAASVQAEAARMLQEEPASA
jgi:hypothetical protein